MNKLSQFIFTLILITASSILFAQSKSSTKKDGYDFDSEKLNKYLVYLNEQNIWRGSVAIMHDGKMIYSKAVGKISDKNNREADSGTKYRIGSITKMYTATLIYELAEKNKLEIDYTIEQYFPKIPNANKITIEMLLGHRSGLPNYLEDDFDLYRKYSEDEMLRMFEKMKPKFKPGKEYDYSNTNYYLLALIIQKVSERSYEEQFKSKILAHRTLMSTYIDDEIIDVNKNEAISFTKDYKNNEWVTVPSWNLHNAMGAGNVSSTAPDVARFLNDLFTAQFINERELRHFTEVDDSGQGLGSFLIPFGSKKSYGHTGGIEAYRNIASYFPEDKIAFAILSNAQDMDNNDVAIGVLSILFGKQFEFKEYSTKPKLIEDATQYVGEYVSDDLPLEIKIFIENDTLFGQATGQGQFPLSASETKDLEFKPAGIRLSFSDFKQGNYQKMVLHQGKSYEYRRK